MFSKDYRVIKYITAHRILLCDMLRMSRLGVMVRLNALDRTIDNWYSPLPGMWTRINPSVSSQRDALQRAKDDLERKLIMARNAVQEVAVFAEPRDVPLVAACLMAPPHLNLWLN